MNTCHCEITNQSVDYNFLFRIKYSDDFKEILLPVTDFLCRRMTTQITIPHIMGISIHVFIL